jgi:hypothetical protein
MTDRASCGSPVTSTVGDEMAVSRPVPTPTVPSRCPRTGVGPRALRVGRHLRYEPTEVRRWLAEDCTRRERSA